MTTDTTSDRCPWCGDISDSPKHQAHCSWCGTDPTEAATYHEGSHATWCAHYRRGQMMPPDGAGIRARGYRAGE